MHQQQEEDDVYGIETPDTEPKIKVIDPAKNAKVKVLSDKKENNVVVNAQVLKKGDKSHNTDVSKSEAYIEIKRHFNGTETITPKVINKESVIDQKAINETQSMVVSLDKHNEIAHDSKINGTSVTIGDILAHGDSLKVGKNTF